MGNKQFNKKMNALREASRSRLPIEWWYHNELFTFTAKQPRVSTPLVDMYKQRAKQLREQYDYLILAYSGGADSDNILKTFTHHNIKLDEVWCDQPLSLFDKGEYKLNYSTDPWNMPVEWFTVIKPELERLAITHPEIKIHISDSFAPLENEDFDDTSYVISAPTSYTATKRYRYLFNYLQTFVQKGIRVGVIFGMDKPIPGKKGNKYGFVIADYATCVKTHATNQQFVDIEYFYWSPDYPLLAVEMARRVWDVLLSTESNLRYAMQLFEIRRIDPDHVFHRQMTFDDVVKKVCYPHWDYSKIQVGKSHVFRNLQYEPYMRKFTKERFYQSWLHNIRDSVKGLDPQLCFRDNISIDSDTKQWNLFFELGELK